MTRTVQRLAALGKQLGQPPHTKDAILKQLKQAAEMLSEMKQSQDVSPTLQPLTKALALPTLIKHKDKDVRLLATSCVMEVLRIVAPDAPYSDRELQDIFQEAVSAFEGLNETSSSSFARRTAILEIMANLRICVVMLDVGCDDLIPEMFQTFFSVVSDKHPPSVFTAMQTIIAAILEESEKIPLSLLDILLNNLLKHKKGVSSAAHKLAVGVVQHCAEMLEPYIQRLLTSVMLEGKETDIDLHADYHDIIHELYQCAPEMLLAVIPNLTQELVNDQVNVRLKAVKLLGRLFAFPGQHVAKEYRQLFLEFLKRFTDKVAEVRLTMIDCAKDCLKANPSGNEATEFLAGLDDRILDSEESVRLRTVTVICDLARQNFKWVPIPVLKHVAERLRDKKVLVRKETFQRLAEVYKAYATKCYDGVTSVDKQLEWIPGKLLRCCYDKDVKEFRPAGLESLFAEKLFPRQLSVSERAKHWIAMYSLFEDMDKKALAKILLQKRRLQEDVLKFLSARQKEKETGQDQSEIQQLFKGISLLFVDDKAEEHLQKLHNMKDKKVFKALSDLLNPQTTFNESELIINDLLKRVGEHHPQHDFIRTLAVRCSFILFGEEHVKSILKEVFSENDSSSNAADAGLSLLAEVAGIFPFLIQSVKEEVLGLLLEGDGMVKERVADILARAGKSVFGQSGVSSSVEVTLQKLCLEGSRKRAKYAVSALAAVNVDEGFKALSILYGRLLGQMQEKNPHLPTVLQSLSCIAKVAISVFETQEDDIVRFVVRSLLQKDSEVDMKSAEYGDLGSPSKICQLKIFGLKTLVKSFLPLKQHPRRRLRGLLGLLSKLLPNGEISESIKSSEIDKAHLRLASVKGLVRLARRWDAQVPQPIFHLCLLMAQDPYINVRQGFLKKLHQYLKDHSLSHKYASGYALFAMDTSKEILSDAKHYLSDFIENARLEAKLQQKPVSHVDGSLITYNPEYALTYLVHVLAHHPSFPISEIENVDLYEPFYRMLLFYLRPLMHRDNEDIISGGNDNLPAILAIFRTIKKAEDVLEGNKTACIRTVCDMGIAITKELGSNSLHSDVYPGQIPLPSSLYKVNLDDVDDGSLVDGSNLPACLNDGDVFSHVWFRGSRSGQAQPNLASSTALRKDKAVAEVSALKQSERHSLVSNGMVETSENDVLVQNTMKPTGSANGGRVLRKRGMVAERNVEEKSSTESEKLSVSERLRRSRKLVNETAEASRVKPLAITTSEPLVSGKEENNPYEHETIHAGRVLRKRGVVAELQGEEKISVESDKSSVLESPRMRSLLESPRKMRVLESPRRSRRLSNGMTEAAVEETLQVDTVKSASPVSEGRVLRKKYNTAIDQQIEERKTAEPDEEITATWRTRRRKVQ